MRKDIVLSIWAASLLLFAITDCSAFARPQPSSIMLDQSGAIPPARNGPSAEPRLSGTRDGSLACWGVRPCNVLFASQNSGEVDVYRQKDLKLVAQLGLTGPLATDRQSNLYAPWGSSGGIGVFALGSDTPKLILQAPHSPSTIAVSTTGEVAATAGTELTFFKAGATTPCNVIADVNVTFGSIAFDKAGKLYAQVVETGSAPGVVEIKGGCHARHVAALDLMISNPEWLTVDNQGNLDVEAGSWVIEQFHAGETSPFNTITLNGLGFDSGGFVLTKSNHDVWLGQQQASYPSSAAEFAFPAGGSPIQQKLCPASCGWFTSLAAIPASVPGP